MADNTLRKRRKPRLGRWAAVLALGLASCQAVGPGTPALSGGGCRPDPALFAPGSALVAMGGDVMMHRLIQEDAAARSEHFRPAFAPIARYLRMADVTVVNLESPAARDVLPGGRVSATPAASRFDDRIYSGYPTFNAHPSIARDLATLGVDVVQTANNHALDRGPEGVDRTLAALRAAGLATTGTRARGAEGPWHTVVNLPMRGGAARVAFMACTFSANGLPDPDRQSLRCYDHRPGIAARIRALLADPGIDAVILTPHWGAEYGARPNARQRHLAREAIAAGAAAVVGAHPHVLQPIEEVTAPDGRPAFVAYSLGNLLASQWELPQRTGGLLFFGLSRDAEGRVVAGPPRLLPTRGERYVGNGVTVLPAHDIPTGGPSVAHAAAIVGAERVIAPSALGCGG